MDYIHNEFLGEEIVPVILGSNREAKECAKRMFRRFGVISHLFGCRSLPFYHGCARCHNICHTEKEMLMLYALMDFAKELEHRDLILYLIPTDPEYAVLVFEHRAELERCYVIADEEEMEKVWTMEKY